MKNENYITIQGFMVNDLKLKGNELLIYAIIYGFTQLDNQEFNGSLQYLADWCNSTKQGIIKCLKSLIDKDLIERKEATFNNIKFVSYSTKFNGIKQSLTGYSTEFNGGIKQSLPNNIINNIDDNINIIREKRFVPPTVEEVAEYIKSKNYTVDPESFVNFYESKGWYVGKNKMKDWKSAVNVWQRKTHSISNLNHKRIAETPSWYDEWEKEFLKNTSPKKTDDVPNEELYKIAKDLFPNDKI